MGRSIPREIKTPGTGPNYPSPSARHDTSTKANAPSTTDTAPSDPDHDGPLGQKRAPSLSGTSYSRVHRTPIAGPSNYPKRPNRPRTPSSSDKDETPPPQPQRRLSFDTHYSREHKADAADRHLYPKRLDGSTTGPRTFQGEIGRRIEEDLKTLPIVEFRRVRGRVERPNSSVISSLSQCQKYLLEMSLACQSGHSAFLSKEGLALARRSPKCLNHSRWLTRANRVLRLYVSSQNPPPSLSRMVFIILNGYAFNWFLIKKNDGFLNGSKSFFEMVRGYQEILTLDEQDIIEPVLSRNNFFGNPENVLISMLYDNSKSIRKKAVAAILEAWERANESNNDLRKFVTHPINMKASSYVELVDWKNKNQIFEPPLTMKCSNEDLFAQIDNPGRGLQVPDVPYHTQSVERHVKLVSEVSSRVYGFRNRHHEILNTLQSQKEMPKFDNKRMFPLNDAEP